MGICSDVSRRHMLALSAAAGGLAVSGYRVGVPFGNAALARRA